VTALLAPSRDVQCCHSELAVKRTLKGKIEGEHMAIRAVLSAIFWLAISVPSLGQTTQGDSQTLQEILTELRGIHDDIRATGTSQILLVELEMQQSLVNHATQRVEEAQSKVNQIQIAQQHNAGDEARLEDELSQSTDPSQTKRINDDIERVKARIAALKFEERQDSTNLQEAEDQLRSAQDTLDALQDKLNKIVKHLHPDLN
jgi:chromosome segregation ATPase